VQSYMYTLSNKQEQYILDARSYAANLAALNVPAPKEIDGKYAVTVTADMTTTPPSYLITATPQGAQAVQDAACGTLTLNQTGTKTKSGAGTGVSDCW
jgi:type IV pilus assembly protein PilE